MPKPKIGRNAPFKTLIFKEVYKDFFDFYASNKNSIYKSVVELFSEFKNTRRKKLKLHIIANIQELVWDTEFVFTKEEYYLLKRDFMPYFEKIEDYETCSEIIKTYDFIKSNLKIKESVSN